jgi:gas vesicle protein
MSSPPPKHSLSSPTSGNSPQQVLPTPSSSTSVSIRQLNHNKQTQMKRELEQQLIEKQKQLQESNSGIGKNVLARQVSQLQDRLKEIDENISNEELQPTSIDRLRSLERDLTSHRSHPLSPGISSIRNKEKVSC